MIKKIISFIQKLRHGYWLTEEDERYARAFRILLAAELRKMDMDECYLYARHCGLPDRYVGVLASMLRARSGRGTGEPGKILELIMRELGQGVRRAS